jgi:hypothetical protein
MIDDARSNAAEREDTTARETALAGAVKEFAGELRLTEIVDLITFIRTENHPNIGDLVNSSAELYFEPGSLCYGWGADVDMPWTGSPSVKLDLEFRHRQVTAFFRLTLQPRQAGIDLIHIAFEKPDSDPAINTRCLEEALREARRPLQVAASA